MKTACAGSSNPREICIHFACKKIMHKMCTFISIIVRFFVNYGKLPFFPLFMIAANPKTIFFHRFRFSSLFAVFALLNRGAHTLLIFMLNRCFLDDVASEAKKFLFVAHFLSSSRSFSLSLSHSSSSRSSLLFVRLLPAHRRLHIFSLFVEFFFGLMSTA